MSCHSAGGPGWGRSNPQDFHSPIGDHVLAFVSTPIPHLQRLLLVAVGHSAVYKRTFQPSQERLGEMMSRSDRTVRRALRGLQEGGLIRIVRRGRTLTNLYLLARWLFERITIRWRGRRGKEKSQGGLLDDGQHRGDDRGARNHFGPLAGPSGPLGDD